MVFSIRAAGMRVARAALGEALTVLALPMS